MYTIIKAARMEIFDNQKLNLTPNAVKTITGKAYK